MIYDEDVEFATWTLLLLDLLCVSKTFILWICSFVFLIMYIDQPNFFNVDHKYRDIWSQWRSQDFRRQGLWFPSIWFPNLENPDRQKRLSSSSWFHHWKNHDKQKKVVNQLLYYIGIYGPLELCMQWNIFSRTARGLLTPKPSLATPLHETERCLWLSLSVVCELICFYQSILLFNHLNQSSAVWGFASLLDCRF